VRRLLVLVEGPTEGAFVDAILQPHLLEVGVSARFTILSTKKRKDGAKFKGGATSYGKIRRELKRLLGDSDAAAVTTMLDYYGLPRDFPGLTQINQSGSKDCYERTEALEAALLEDLQDRRVIPYLSLHEFEALVFSDLAELERTVRHEGLCERLQEAVGSAEPEEINDGPETHPSARLSAHFPAYSKTTDGPRTLERIGLPRLRARCIHFDTWVTRLEGLGRPP
jgi:hypothetical protein